jgi:hypothetical protein
MIKLPTVTLMCIDCIDVDRAIMTLEKSSKGIEFGQIKLLTSTQEGVKNIPKDYPHEIIPHLGSLTAYSIFMLTMLYKYINTTHALIVQHDGYVINPHKWQDSFLNYDYIAPLFDDHDIMGCGGFTLRTKAIMEAVASMCPEWDGTQQDAEAIQNGTSQGFYEDGLIAIKLRDRLESKGFKFAPIQEASLFGQARNNKHYNPEPFGFHRGFEPLNT